MKQVNIIGTISEKKFKEVLKAINVGEDGPLEVILCSEGGSFYDAIAIAGLLANYPHPVTIKAYGCVMSAAVLILACGDHREAAEGTVILVHEVREKVKEMHTVSSIAAKAKQMATDESEWNRLMEHYTSTDRAVWGTLSTAESYVSLPKALDLKLIDKVMVPDEQN